MIAIRNSFWAVLALAALVGCEEAPKPAAPAASPSPAAEDKKPEAKPAEKPAEKKADAAAPKKLTDDQIAQIKKLPEDEQKIAMAQVFCPINEDKANLGDMGKPFKVVLNGQTVFLCCKGCEKDALADPAGTLAKLGKK